MEKPWRAAIDLSGLYVRFVVKKHGAQGTHVPGKADQRRGPIFDRKPGF